MVLFLFFLSLFWIIAATIEDFKKKEIENWISFSLIIFALGFRFFHSLFFEDFNFFYQGIFGLLAFFIIGNVFYYSRFFAGGDSKLFMSLGPIIFLSLDLKNNLSLTLFFLVLFFVISAIYIIIASTYLAFKNSKKTIKEFKKQFEYNKKNIYAILIFSLILMVFGLIFFEFLFFLGFLFFLLPYFFILLKSIEEACLIKKIDTKNLTEGDWLYEDVKIGRNTIKKSWHGLTKKEINLIRKKYKKIKIKEGIPFTPTFLISIVIFFLLKVF
ncbi:MAG: hypothetical protein KatS3mg001_381 [Candidatus Pacearchaeota archaeon]|nr:MAG: hypothetical protein KatS3mg001_381 [Candidatus Pacearchaeota archaeon]